MVIFKRLFFSGIYSEDCFDRVVILFNFRIWVCEYLVDVILTVKNFGFCKCFFLLFNFLNIYLKECTLCVCVGVCVCVCLQSYICIWTINWLLDEPPYGSRSLTHASQAGKSSVVREKISAITSPLTSGRLTPQIAIPLIITWVSAVEGETYETPWNTKDDQKASVIVIFTKFKQGNHLKVLQKNSKSSGGCGWNQWWFLKKYI